MDPLSRSDYVGFRSPRQNGELFVRRTSKSSPEKMQRSFSEKCQSPRITPTQKGVVPTPRNTLRTSVEIPPLNIRSPRHVKGLSWGPESRRKRRVDVQSSSESDSFEPAKSEKEKFKDCDEYCNFADFLLKQDRFLKESDTQSLHYIISKIFHFANLGKNEFVHRSKGKRSFTYLLDKIRKSPVFESSPFLQEELSTCYALVTKQQSYYHVCQALLIELTKIQNLFRVTSVAKSKLLEIVGRSQRHAINKARMKIKKRVSHLRESNEIMKFFTLCRLRSIVKSISPEHYSKLVPLYIAEPEVLRCEIDGNISSVKQVLLGYEEKVKELSQFIKLLSSFPAWLVDQEKQDFLLQRSTTIGKMRERLQTSFTALFNASKAYALRKKIIRWDEMKKIQSDFDDCFNSENSNRYSWGSLSKVILEFASLIVNEEKVRASKGRRRNSFSSTNDSGKKEYAKAFRGRSCSSFSSANDSDKKEYAKAFRGKSCSSFSSANDSDTDSLELEKLETIPSDEEK